MTDLRRYCFALDLRDDPTLIAEYSRYHESIWPEIEASIRVAGVERMEIYRLGARLFMVMEVSPRFSFEAFREANRENPKVQEWEALMGKYQKRLPEAGPGEKWVLMERIFQLPG